MASRYRRIAIRMWGDEKFKALSRPQPNAQSLWVYLLAGKHTLAIPGLSCIGEKALAETLGWSLRAFRGCFAEIADKGMAQADWENQVVWLPNAAEHNPPENPNVVKAWAKSLEEVPECALKTEGIEKTVDFLKAFGPTFVKAFIETIPKGFPETFMKDFAKQEQEQEQDIPSIIPQGAGDIEPFESPEALKNIFDQARQLYPGTKRGLDTEWDYFRTNPRTRNDWQTEVHKLFLGLQVLIARRAATEARNAKLTDARKREFIPAWKNFKTWIYNRCWEEAVENG